MTDVPLNGQKDSLIVTWVEIIESDKKGKQLYKNCFVTNLSVTRTNALAIAQAGRARWKIENETFNTLKNQGYHFEHNYGHGKKNLANVLACMNVLAFTFHSLANMIDAAYKKSRTFLSTQRLLFKSQNPHKIDLLHKPFLCSAFTEFSSSYAAPLLSFTKYSIFLY